MTPGLAWWLIVAALAVVAAVIVSNRSASAQYLAIAARDARDAAKSARATRASMRGRRAYGRRMVRSRRAPHALITARSAATAPAREVPQAPAPAIGPGLDPAYPMIPIRVRTSRHAAVWRPTARVSPPEATRSLAVVQSAGLTLRAPWVGLFFVGALLVLAAMGGAVLGLTRGASHGIH